MIFFFHLHSFKSPVKWVPGPESEMCTRGRYVSRNPLSTEFRSIYEFTSRSPSLTRHRVHPSFSFVFPFSDAGASIALDSFTDVSPQSKRESLPPPPNQHRENSCMEDVKMKNVFSGKTMDALCCVLVVATWGVGQTQVTIFAICTRRQTPTLTQAFQEKEVTDSC